MNRKTFTLGLVIATTAIALNACSDRKKTILGKWKVNDNNDTMTFEFLANGTTQITVNGERFLSGKYTFADDKITIDSSDGVSSTSTVKFEGDNRIIMTQTSGDILILNRIKD